MRRIPVLMIMSLWLGVGQAQAQVDPVDKNFGGPYVGGQLIMGQSFKAGSGSPGAAVLGGAEFGLGIKRDTWNRIELGVEVDTGAATFSEDSPTGDVQVDLKLNLVTMIKAGYGYSLGDNAFGTFRVGIGLVQAGYSADVNGTNQSAVTTGVASMIGWDAYYPVNQSLDLLAGASYRIFNMKFKDQDSMQLSLPNLYLGARFRL